MIKSDQWIVIILVVLITIYATVWATGYFTHKLSYFFAFINSAAAIVIIGYWAVNEIKISQHSIEGREIIVLSLELLIAAVSIYNILNHSTTSSFKIAHYIIFGIHFTVLIVGLIFMLAFKFNKLF